MATSSTEKGTDAMSYEVPKIKLDPAKLLGFDQAMALAVKVGRKPSPPSPPPPP